jgi:hypothetical protein
MTVPPLFLSFCVAAICVITAGASPIPADGFEMRGFPDINTGLWYTVNNEVVTTGKYEPNLLAIDGDRGAVVSTRLLGDGTLTQGFFYADTYRCLSNDSFQHIMNVYSLPTGRKFRVCSLAKITAEGREYASSETHCPDSFDVDVDEYNTTSTYILHMFSERMNNTE